MSYSSTWYFEIDIADIYRNESNHYASGAKDLRYLKDFHNKLWPISYHNGTKPFLTPQSVTDNRFGADYYDRLYSWANQENQNDVYPYYCVNGNIYNIHSPCIISRLGIEENAFMLLFALKLSSYTPDLIFLPKFLYFQLFRNFKGNTSEFHEFLRLVLEKHLVLIGKRTCKQVAYHLSTFEYLTKREAVKTFTEVSKKGQESASRSDFHLTTAVSEKYYYVDGKFTIEQIQFYFSFLYKVLSAEGKPFLAKEIVEEILRYGIAIPPNNNTVLCFKLNVSKKFPLAIIHYAIHQFYLLHAADKYTKSEVLRFFCYYFEDFAWALKSPEDYKNFMSNISGTRPSKKMKFNLEDYIPLEHITPIPLVQE